MNRLLQQSQASQSGWKIIYIMIHSNGRTIRFDLIKSDCGWYLLGRTCLYTSASQSHYPPQFAFNIIICVLVQLFVSPMAQ